MRDTKTNIPKCKFELWPTLITAIMFCILLGLGIWQLHRLNIKNALLTDIYSKIESPPTAFLGDVSNLQEMRYRQYTLLGNFLYEKSMYLYGGNPSNNSEQGYFVITPFVVAGNNMHILINRGWISLSKAKTFLQRTTQDRVTKITTVFMVPNQVSIFSPDNDLKRNIWFYMDMENMSKFTGCIIEKGFYMTLVQKDKESQGLVQPSIQSFFMYIKNDHLIYAITWFSLGFGLLCVYFAYHRYKS